jgi:putative tricarboxylic transport membrane protein
MENFLSHAIPALAAVFSGKFLLLMLFGVIYGIVLGILPGFGAAQALALAFPFTYGMSTTGAVLFFIAIYSAAEYGGSIPAILIRTPGTPSAAVTVLDGYAMARKGFPNRALQISLGCGVVGGIISTLIFILAGAALSWIGLLFGPSQMFAVGVFGLSIIGGFLGKSAAKGFLATGIGLLLATVGSSGFGGMRFTFNQAWLLDGIPLIVLIIGLLAVPEALRLMIDDRNLVRERIDTAGNTATAKTDRMTYGDWRRLVPSMLRGSLIGTLVGVQPGAGGAVASILAYNEEKRFSKNPELFGTGIDEGIAAPETANNAVVAGALVPTLTFGIPGSGSAAILLGIMTTKGVVPGPSLFSQHASFVMAIFFGLIVCNLIMLAVGLAGAKLWGQVTKIPPHVLGPFIMLLIVVGAYSYQTQAADVIMTLILGVIAYYFEKVAIPVIPIVLAFIMGSIIEQNLNRALTIHAGDVTAVLSQPITVVILLLSAVTAILAFRRSRSYGK